MPVRSTMTDLISRTRDLAGDPAGPTQQFTDQQYQDALDRDRIDFAVSDFRELAGRYSTPSGIFTWTDYFDPAGWGNWEQGTVLYNGALIAVTPATSDLLIGHWTFTGNGQPPPVFVTGVTYDPHAAARLIVLRWIAKEATSFDFSIDRGLSFSVSQKRAGLKMLADELSSEMRVRSARVVRRDVSSALNY